MREAVDDGISEGVLLMARSSKDRGQGEGEVVRDDPEQYQRFLEAARQLGLDPTSETDLRRLNPVLRRMAKMPPQRRGPLREDEEEAPEPDEGSAKS
jgi:hypothetical protein